MIKIKYDKSKGHRMKRCFIGMTNFDRWIWNETLRRWEKLSDLRPDCDYSSHKSCKTIKAFRRNLKTAPKVLFKLQNRYVGYSVYGMGKGGE